MMTRCAACGTAFRITTDQLLARQGTVRCGNCQAIFNALDRLVPDPATQEAEGATGGADSGLHDVAARAAFDLFNAAPSPAGSAPTDEPAVIEAAQEAVADELAGVDFSSAAAGFQSGTALLPSEATDIRAGADAAAASSPTPEPFGEAPVAAMGVRATAVEGTVSPLFGPGEPNRGFPWWSTAGVLITLAALAAQGAWFYRNQLAALYPQAKPLLEAVCAELRCHIETPVDPQAISIESSDLQADPANRAVLILSAVVRNRAPFAQKLPLLELSLTDAQDAPIARRVLKAPEYAPAPAPESIGPGSELQLRVFIDASAVKANGYRLYAFFP
jgi:predicted Zn finger-like uncharacterized protein